MKMTKLTQKRKKKSPNASKSPKTKEPVDEEKENLKQDVSKLRSLISRSEVALRISKCEKTTEFSNLKLREKPREIRTKSRIKNWGLILQYELYKLSGLYCTKSEADEFIFNFDPSSSGRDDSIFGIQIFMREEQESIGKKIMPTIDFIESLLVETPLREAKEAVPFLKNCWRHLDCFNDRKLQVQELQKAAEDIKNISIDADMGFNMVIINLGSVYDKIQDSLLNITIYFSYENGSARPRFINVDWSLKNKPTEESAKSMKSFVKIFKKLPLHEALLEIVHRTHPNFSWDPEKRENTSTIDLQAVSGSEEDSESSVEVKTTKKKAKKGKRKRVASQEFEEDLGASSQEHLDLTVEKSLVKKTKKQEPIKKVVKKAKKTDTKKPELRQSLLNFEKRPGPASQTKDLPPEPDDNDDDNSSETAKINPKRKPLPTSTPMPQKNTNDKLKKNPVVVLEMSPISGDKNSGTNVSGDENSKENVSEDERKSIKPGPKSSKVVKPAVEKKTKIPVVVKKKVQKKK